MLDALASTEYFPSTFAVLVACYVCLKLMARHWPRKRKAWFARGRSPGPARKPEEPQDLEGLLRLAQKAPAREVQLAAIHSLGERKLKASIPILGRLLSAEDPVVASEAANSLGAIGDPAALAFLEAASDALEREISDALVAGPAQPRRLGKPVAHPWERVLQPLAKNNFRAFDKYTPHDLRDHSEEEIVQMLLAMAANGEEPVANRYNALKNLELFRHPDIAPKLREMLFDPHTTVRYTAAEVLAVHGNEDSVEALLEKLGDPNRFVRSSAAMTLAVLGSDRAIAPLMKLADDPDDVVRYSVDKALDSIGKKKKLGSIFTRRERAG